MTPEEMLAGLQRRIPLTKALGLGVARFDVREVILTAPFEPNRNHVDTVFGGSLYAIGALACYGLFQAISAESGLLSDNLVIQNGQIQYLAPVTADFQAHVLRPAEAEVERFLEGLRRRGKGRLVLRASLVQDGQEKAIFEGAYVFKDEPLKA